MARICVVSFKECWRDPDGRWYSYGGFPAQMAGLASLFDAMTLVIVQAEPRAGGIPLPAGARVVPLRRPAGRDLRRKVSVAASLPYYLLEIRREVRQADVVHTPLPGDIALLGFLAALLQRKRLLARYGGAWTQNQASTLMNRITRQCMRIAAGGRNVMLATGGGIEPPAPGVSWIFATAINRAEVESVHPDLDRGVGRPVRLIYAGRLSPEKGVHHLIEAVRRLHQAAGASGPEFRLVLAGDGPQRAELTRQVEQGGCGELVEFLGQLNRQALLRELNRSDLCVLPSLTESFCKARLDAMLCGLPVLTTAVGFGREIVGQDGERGWVVPAGDPQALATAIERVARGEWNWPALRRRCRAHTEALTIEAWVARIGEACASTWGATLRDGKLRL